MSASPAPPYKFSTAGYFRRERGAIAGLALLTLLAAQAESIGLMLVAPLAQAISAGESRVDARLGPMELTAENSSLAVLSLALIFVAAALTVAALAVRSALVTRKLQQQRDRLVTAFTEATWGYQSTARSARLQVLNGFAHYSGRALMAISQALRALLSLMVFVTVAFVIDWRSTLFITIVGAVLTAALWPLVRYGRRMQGRLADQGAAYAEELFECGDQARELRVYRAFPFLRARLGARSADLRSIEQRAAFWGGLVTPVYQYAALSSIVVVLLVMNTGNSDQIVSVAAVALLLLRSLSFGQQLQSSIQQMMETLPYIERFDAAIIEHETERDEDGGDELGSVETLGLHEVSFTYDGVEVALVEVDLTIRSGEAVGLVGPSGSGKSTLSQIVLRLREPSSGRFDVNGRPAKVYSADSFYRRITHVPQESRLLIGTVAENIAFLDPTIPRSDIVDAARRVGLHDFVTTLADGYDTAVGPGSRDLSGGQVQRVGIARALVRKPDVLVLDEPTSALDVHTESVIQEALSNMPEHMILIVIAHRLSTIKACDRVLVLEDGRVAADGAFQAVYRENAFFRRSVDLGRLDIAPAGLDDPNRELAVAKGAVGTPDSEQESA